MLLKLPIDSPYQPAFDLSFQTLYNHRNQALLRVQASDDTSTDHQPTSLVLVIDVSGSMNSPAKTADDSDGASGLSQLDIVKHASLTILEALQEQDRLAIVSFHSNAKIEFPLQFMTAANKAQARRAIDALVPLCSTNLYGGLHMAMELLRTHVPDESITTLPSNPNIFLLTDGLPNVSPPRGEVATLQRYLDAHPRLQQQVRISTFGFGYDLDSKMLADIASVGRSLFGFIPDSSFVGTVFVNAIANTLACACSTSSSIKLEATNGVKLLGCPTGQTVTHTPWGLQIDLPSLLYGQSMDILVQWEPTSTTTDATAPAVGETPPFTAFLEFDGQDQGLLHETPQFIDPVTNPGADLLFRRAGVRAAIIGFVKSAEECSSPTDLAEAQAILKDWKVQARNMAPVDPSLFGNTKDAATVHDIESILEDLEGQVTEAYSRWDWHTRWGYHYVRSLVAAHILQQCSNFKDPGLQTYLTEKSSALRDAAEERFLALPPPKPSRGTPKVQVTSMRTFYNASSGCFGGGPVLMADGSKRDISLLRAGDHLYSRSGPVKVICIVETPTPNGVEGLVSLPGGITVTPWHPVRKMDASNWTFPYQVVFPQWKSCDRVFNLVLEKGGSCFRIGDFDAVSLGHGLKNDPVAEHSYFGTERVIEDLQKLRGWATGRVVLPLNPFQRDPKSGQVMGINTEQTGSIEYVRVGPKGQRLIC